MINIHTISPLVVFLWGHGPLIGCIWWYSSSIMSFRHSAPPLVTCAVYNWLCCDDRYGSYLWSIWKLLPNHGSSWRRFLVHGRSIKWDVAMDGMWMQHSLLLRMLVMPKRVWCLYWWKPFDKEFPWCPSSSRSSLIMRGSKWLAYTKRIALVPV